MAKKNVLNIYNQICSHDTRARGLEQLKPKDISHQGCPFALPATGQHFLATSANGKECNETSLSLGICQCGQHLACMYNALLVQRLPNSSSMFLSVLQQLTRRDHALHLIDCKNQQDLGTAPQAFICSSLQQHQIIFVHRPT
jgi:hypothetical protein